MPKKTEIQLEKLKFWFSLFNFFLKFVISVLHYIRIDTFKNTGRPFQKFFIADDYRSTSKVPYPYDRVPRKICQSISLVKIENFPDQKLHAFLQ